MWGIFNQSCNLLELGYPWNEQQGAILTGLGKLPHAESVLEH